MEQFLIENSLHCLNTNFQKKKGKLWTHTHQNGFKAQFDFIIVNKKWINSARNCEAYNTFEGVLSDHRIFSIIFILSLRADKKTTLNKKHYNWCILTTYKSIRQNYAKYLKNHFENAVKTCKTTNEKYIAFVNAHTESTKKHIPLKAKFKKRVPWENKIIEEKRTELKQLFTLMRSNIAELSKYLQKQIEDITMAADNKKSALAWKIVNRISGRKSTNRSKIKVIDQTERLQNWKNHFSSLLGENPIITHQTTVKIVNKELAIEQGTFTLEELETVLAKTKLNKSASIDDILPEV